MIKILELFSSLFLSQVGFILLSHSFGNITLCFAGSLIHMEADPKGGTFDHFWELHWAGSSLNHPARNVEEKNG